MHYNIVLLLSLMLNFTMHAIEFKILSCHNEPYSRITFIRDEHANNYVIKQVLEEDLKQQFLLIMDCLTAEIAAQAGIPCNKITLIPAFQDHVGKQWHHLPATLHTFAQGVMLTESKQFNELEIQQRYRAIGGWLWKKEGMLSLKWRGLTATAIEHMALHPQLPALVAFDTFIGNNDRARTNLFYDEITNSFCGIDMANAYGQNLCKEAICQLLRLHRDNRHQFTAPELEALEMYRKMLCKLITQFPPKKLHIRLDELVALANMAHIPYDHLSLKECIAFYKDMITESYHDALALETLLELLEPAS
ncbi:MAG: hypothetical protein AB7F19_06255 [Candidatus Babeliales bacterium]